MIGPKIIEKLRIKSYGNEKRVRSFWSLLLVKDYYQVQFNPESYSFQYENEYQGLQGINTAGRTARYSLTRARTLSLKFIIDDSSATAGLLSGAPSIPILRNTIEDEVNDFLKLAGQMDGNLHEPRYLRIEWGDLIYDCRLQSVDVNYTLFSRNGKALRAELDTVFVEDLNPEKLAKLSNKKSPDLTHARIVISGGTLPLMTHGIYRDPAYYMRVAQANKLNNFRKLRAGTTLKFPPLQDTDTSK
ncbi:hypothetical protein [Acaryochloris sp. IP29b_bin.148]|uniref:CIS tube protein n=1 Tax=Acaryochloris sp. IP29b_bin.148 TaxID=2969218 RepID=UPI002619E32E|nr:hypothetical protein [Acaryochloris sp. IP29b_bin.148]